MRILCCIADREGCGRWRMGIPITVLQSQESDLEIKIAGGVPLRWSTRTGEPMGFAAEFGEWDVLVVQRPMTRDQYVGMEDAKRKGIRVVAEIDDDYKSLHPLSPAHVITHPLVSAERNRDWLSKACGIADLVICTTPALARRYAAHGRYAVVPNYIPESWLRIERAAGQRRYDTHTTSARRKPLYVGWTGTVGTHQGDLQVTRGGVARAVEETEARFRVIGQREQVRKALGLTEEPAWVQWTEFEDYPREVARLDVGIAPLADTQFNHAKSGLKPLEMAACGVPCVMSPLPSYRDLHERGIGVLAKDRERDWRREVGRLLSDDSYRVDTGLRGREVAASLTIEKNAWRFAEAWTGSTLDRAPARLTAGR